MDEKLKSDILEKVGERTQKMFLLPALQIREVLEERTIATHRLVLSKLFERIEQAAKPTFDDDQSSIVSVHNSIFTHETDTSMSSIANVDITEAFVTHLVQVEEFRSSLEEALKKLTISKVERNLKRLFKRYAIDLRKEATSQLEVETAKWTRLRSTQLATSVKNVVQHSNLESLQERLQKLQDGGEWEFKLERYFQNQFPAALCHQTAQADSTSPGDVDVSSSDSDDDELDDTDIRLENVKLVKGFLFGGVPFSNLIEEMARFCGRDRKIEDFKDLMEKLNSMFSLRQFSTHSQTWSILNRLKVYIQSKVDGPISFWPLSEPRTLCKKGYTRYYWDCHCGIEMSIDVSDITAQKYTRRAPTSTSQATIPNTSISGQAPSQTALGTTGHAASGIEHHPAPTSPQPVQDQTSTNIPPPIVLKPSGSLIFWCAKETPLSHLMKVIQINYDTEDKGLFAGFADAYNLIRGWRRFFALTHICDIKYARFFRVDCPPGCRADGYCSGFVEALPPRSNTDYESPREPLPPIRGDELLKHFKNPALCRACNYLDMFMPRRVAGPLPGTWRVEAYGLQAIEGKAPLKVILIVAILYLSSTIPFVWWWLINHPNDLQNAFTPTFYIAGLIATVLNVPGLYDII